MLTPKNGINYKFSNDNASAVLRGMANDLVVLFCVT